MTAFPDSMYIHVEINEHGIVTWEPWPKDYPRLYRLKLKQDWIVFHSFMVAVQTE